MRIPFSYDVSKQNPHRSPEGTQAYKRGQTEYFNAVPILDNPYDEAELQQEWENGWKEADKRRQKVFSTPPSSLKKVITNSIFKLPVLNKKKARRDLQVAVCRYLIGYRELADGLMTLNQEDLNRGVDSITKGKENVDVIALQVLFSFTKDRITTMDREQRLLLMKAIQAEEYENIPTALTVIGQITFFSYYWAKHGYFESDDKYWFTYQCANLLGGDDAALVKSVGWYLWELALRFEKSFNKGTQELAKEWRDVS